MTIAFMRIFSVLFAIFGGKKIFHPQASFRDVFQGGLLIVIAGIGTVTSAAIYLWQL